MSSIKHPIPSKPGLYWARDNDSKWYNLVVSVQGKAPFLYGVIFDRATNEIKKPEPATLAGPTMVWGPEIIEPESFIVPKSREEQS